PVRRAASARYHAHAARPRGCRGRRSPNGSEVHSVQNRSTPSIDHTVARVSLTGAVCPDLREVDDESFACAIKTPPPLDEKPLYRAPAPVSDRSRLAFPNRPILAPTWGLDGSFISFSPDVR